MSDTTPVVPTISYGHIYVEPLDEWDHPVGGMRQLGWYETPLVKFSKKEMFVPNNVKKGGGNAKTFRRTDKATFEVTLYNLIPDNMALILNGSYEETISETLTDFERICYKGRLNTFDGIIDTTQPVIVKHGANTYLLDTDFYVTPGGVIIPNSSPIAALDTGSGVALQISLTLKACTAFQINSVSDRAFALRFETFNEAINDTEEIYDYYKVELSGAEELQISGHNDKFASVKINGSLAPVEWRAKKPTDSVWGKMYRAKN